MDQNTDQQPMQQPLPPQGVSNMPSNPPPVEQPVKKTKKSMLMILILVGMLIIFVLLIYVIATNKNVAQIQQIQNDSRVIVPPLPSEKVSPIENVSPPSVSVGTEEDADIDSIESDLKSIDEELLGL